MAKRRQPQQMAMIGESGEVWVPLPPHLGPYDVSNHGRVRNRKTGRVRKPTSDPERGNHHHIVLYGPERRHSVYVHHLVLEAFVGPKPDEAAVCRHLDDDPQNNRSSNLVWGTQQENMLDKQRAGRARGGRKNLSPNDVRIVRELAEDGFSQSQIAGRLGVTRVAIGHILRGVYHQEV
jgi:hypothetical protein